MIKIIHISNTNKIWNNVEMTSDDFNKLIIVLNLSRFTHYIKYVEDGITKSISIGGWNV